jgi:hypothetical protein
MNAAPSTSSPEEAINHNTLPPLQPAVLSQPLTPPTIFPAPLQKRSNRKLVWASAIVAIIVIVFAAFAYFDQGKSSYTWANPVAANNPHISYGLPGSWLHGNAQQPKYLNKLMQQVGSDPIMKNKANQDTLAAWLRARQSTGADTYDVHDNQGSGYGPNQILLISWPATSPDLKQVGANLSRTNADDSLYEARQVESDLNLTGAITSTYLVKNKTSNVILRIDFAYFSNTPKEFNLPDLIAKTVSW